MKFKVFSDEFDGGYRIIEAESYDNAWSWAVSVVGRENNFYEIVEMNQGRGGRRSGSGRPKGSKGIGKWGGEPTVAVRIPVRIANSIESYSEAFESLTALAVFFQSEAEKSKQESRTGTYPRTWDKALKLLEEINEIVGTEPYIF